MKKTIIAFAIIATLILMLPAKASAQIYSKDFLATATTLAAGESKVNGVGITSVEVLIANRGTQGALTVTFTRAAGAATTVDFYFEVSVNGTDWSTFEGSTITIATNHAAVSGTTVRASYIVELGGLSHIRLQKVVNGDPANALTAVNCKISL